MSYITWYASLVYLYLLYYVCMYSETSLSGHLFNKTTSLQWPPLVGPKHSSKVLSNLINKSTSLMGPKFLVPEAALLMRFHCIPKKYACLYWAIFQRNISMTQSILKLYLFLICLLPFVLFGQPYSMQVTSVCLQCSRHKQNCSTKPLSYPCTKVTGGLKQYLG